MRGVKQNSVTADVVKAIEFLNSKGYGVTWRANKKWNVTKPNSNRIFGIGWTDAYLLKFAKEVAEEESKIKNPTSTQVKRCKKILDEAGNTDGITFGNEEKIDFDVTRRNPKGDSRYQVMIHPKNSQSQEQSISLDVWASSKTRAVAQAKAQVRAMNRKATDYTYQPFLSVDTRNNPHGFVIVDEHLNVQMRSANYDKLQDTVDRHNEKYDEKWFVVDESDIKEMKQPKKRNAFTSNYRSLSTDRKKEHVLALLVGITPDVIYSNYTHKGINIEPRIKELWQDASTHTLELIQRDYPVLYKRYNKMKNQRNAARKVVANRDEVDEHAATELFLYVHTGGEPSKVMIESVRKNLVTKKARGNYNHNLAVKGATNLMTRAAEKYIREFGSRGDKVSDLFNTPTREAAAKEWIEHFENEMEIGNYDYLLPKKYQKNPNANGGEVKNPSTTFYLRWFTPNGRETIVRYEYDGIGSQSGYTLGTWKRRVIAFGKREGMRYKGQSNEQEYYGQYEKRNPNANGGEVFNEHKLDELSGIFQGEINGRTIKTVGSDYTPSLTSRLGKLVKMVLKNGRDTYEIEFSGDAYLSADARKNLYIEGRKAKINGVEKPPKGALHLLGEVQQIHYVTNKKHIENGQTVEYYHELGEVDGVRPNAFLDHDAFPILVGGGYDIGINGIEN